MAPIPQHNKAWLLKAAKELALNLKPQIQGTELRLRHKITAATTLTAGWSAVIGSLGKGEPTAELWLDRFSGHPERKLYVCYYSPLKRQIASLNRNVLNTLGPVRTITDADLNEGKYYCLHQKLSRREFNVPIIEHYDERRYHFFGFYDPTLETSAGISPQFIERAMGFLLDVARSQPRAKGSDNQGEVYSRYENRKLVTAHLRRERNGFLAAQCKLRDNYRCNVCDMSFAESYGEVIGAAFAEAHHIRPLGKLSDKTKTSIEDLITVCANCHRMLHRMEGKPEDIKALRAIFLKQRKART